MPAALPPQATPGNVVGERYVLDAVIGRGGMGVVLAARHLTLGKRVAVKLLLAEADANARARFELEARAAALLSSPHIAQVLDFGVTRDGLAYLVMEFLEGRDLQVERKLRVRLPVEEAVDIVLEASVGIAHAHAAGLVHRDIKPANLFLSDAGGRRVVKVLDFGLIKVMHEGGADLTGTTETFGTPKYMAPEQLRSARSVDVRADQHALAAILFELITGRPPFDGESVPDIIIKIGTEPAPLASSVGVPIPRALEEALQRGMAKRPDQRFPSLAEFAHAIAPFGSARARELAAEIARCLAASLVRRPLAEGSPAGPASAASGVDTRAHPALAVAGPPSLPTAPLGGSSATDAALEPTGPGSLSSGSVERLRPPAAPAAPPRSAAKLVGIAVAAALVSGAAMVIALSRTRASVVEPRGATTTATPSKISSSVPPPPASAPAPTSELPGTAISALPSASAAALPPPSAQLSAEPATARPSMPTPRPPVRPTAKPCKSLDCL
ncbi:MAG: serine/threonine-protein kinase [Polyangiaceae bacterium]